MMIKQVSDQPFTYIVSDGDMQFGTIDEFHQPNGAVVYRALKMKNYSGGYFEEVETKSFAAALEFLRPAVHST